MSTSIHDSSTASAVSLSAAKTQPRQPARATLVVKLTILFVVVLSAGRASGAAIPQRETVAHLSFATLPCPAVAVTLTESSFSPDIVFLEQGKPVAWVNNTNATVTIVSSSTASTPSEIKLYLPFLGTGATGQVAEAALARWAHATRQASLPAEAFRITLAPGQRAAHIFTTPGQFAYFVEGAPQLKGTVEVVASLPPDPAQIAPPLPINVPTTVHSIAHFLYTGDTPLQECLDLTAIDAESATILRGRVTTQTGTALEGVRISILDQPQFGQTLTRADGVYDLVVAGDNSPKTVVFAKSGYIEVQRTIMVPAQEFVVLDDVVMLPFDSQVTTIHLNANAPLQIARGTPVSDDDGERQATLIFPPGTTAELVMPDGSRLPAPVLNVRATEFTVGERGPQAMPAELPPDIAYTYAVELSADEAEAAGAASVVFNRPAYLYLENFLNAPLGLAIPAGYYDRTRARWDASNNGVVVVITRIIDGVAQVDANGDAKPDDESVFALIGMTEAERRALAELYPVGTSLWRTPVPHFSPIDCNLAFAVAVGQSNAQPPSQPSPTPPDLPVDDDPAASDDDKGRILYENQLFHERVPIAGTPFALHYASDRVPGYRAGRSLDIQISGATIPTGVRRINLIIEVAGQRTVQTFPPEPNQHYHFEWDGRDAYGRLVQGSQIAHIILGYTYDIYYRIPAPGDFSFGRPGGAPLLTTEVRDEYTALQAHRVPLGGANWDARGLGLGGWSLNVNHTYIYESSLLLRGDGMRRPLEHSLGGMSPYAGRPTLGPLGDGGPALEASLLGPQELAYAPDGTLYFIDSAPSNWRIRKVDPQGIINTVAGGGSTPAAPGVDAQQANLLHVGQLALGPDGTIYFTTIARVWRIGASGELVVVAGTGEEGDGGDGGPAVQAVLGRGLHGLAVAQDGSVYISDSENARIRRVTPDGQITTVVGGAEVSAAAGAPGDEMPAGNAVLTYPMALAIHPNGELYFADDRRVRVLDHAGTLRTIAGTGEDSSGLNDDGAPALNTPLNPVQQMVFDAQGNLYLATNGPFNTSRIQRIDRRGLLTTVAGRREPSPCALPRCTLTSQLSGTHSPTSVDLAVIWGVAVAPDNRLFFSSGNRVRQRIFQVKSAFDNVASNETAISSLDGLYVYVFDDNGRHLRTLHAFTGVTLLSFGYDSDGRLVTVTDAAGSVTRIEHNVQGAPAAVVAPFGQRTELAVNSDDYLSQVTIPGGSTLAFGYEPGGLMTSVTTPRNSTFSLSYDEVGRLVQVDEPAGARTTLAHTVLATGHQVEVTTAQGQTTTYRVERLGDDGMRRTILYPDGTMYVQTEETKAGQPTRHITMPDGTQLEMFFGPDPRFGFLSPIVASAEIALPSGLKWIGRNEREVTLTDPGNLFAIAEWTERSTVNNRTMTTTYNGASRSFTTTSRAGRVQTFAIDLAGRLICEQREDGVPVYYEYDTAGRLARIREGDDGSAPTTSFVYDTAGNLVEQIDALGRHTSAQYDAAGRMTRLTLPGGGVVEFGYDASGNLASVKPPGRPPHTYAFTPFNAIEHAHWPAVGGTLASQTFTYDPDRHLTQMQLADSRLVSVAYDAAGRPNTVTTPEHVTSAIYAPGTGQLAALNKTQGSLQLDLAFAYNGPYITSQVVNGPVINQVTMVVNNNLAPGSIAVGESSINYAYDLDLLPTQAGDMALTWDASRPLLLETTLGKIKDAYTYDQWGRLTGYVARVDGAVVYSYTLSLDAIGRVAGKHEMIEGVESQFAYLYDAAGRLSGVRRNGVLHEHYVYDANGNRISMQRDGSSITATYDDRDRLIQAGDVTYQYNAAGQLASRTQGPVSTLYAYDAQGTLIGATGPGGEQLVYGIDGANRRVLRLVNNNVTHRWLYLDALRPIAELDSAGALVAHFVYAGRQNTPAYMLKGGAAYRLITDHLGSVRLVIQAASGDITQRLDYDTFGRVLVDTQPGFQPFGFAGGLYDPITGLVHFGQRDYDPDAGRWTTTDPLGFGGGDSNLYAYVGNRPVDLLDLEGEGCQSWGLVVNVQGDVSTQFAGDDGWAPIWSSRLLTDPDDKIRTGDDSVARVQDARGNVFSIGPNTCTSLREIEAEARKHGLETGPPSWLERFRDAVRRGNRFDVETPNAVIGARG